jgi:hypothetical protein
VLLEEKEEVKEEKKDAQVRCIYGTFNSRNKSHN